MVSRETIILVDTDGLSLWECPTLSPRVGTSLPSSIGPRSPIMTIGHPRLYPSLAGYTQQSDWYSHCNLPVRFNILSRDNQGGIQVLCRYVLQDIPNHLEANLPSCIPVLMDILAVPAETDDAEFLGQMWRCDQDLIQTWFVDGSLFANVAHIPSWRQEDMSPLVSISRKIWDLSSSVNFRNVAYDLDPVSGRLCVESGDTEIHVVDYLV